MTRTKARRASGITPACAGKRQSTRAALLRNRDHPRMCGEKTQVAEREECSKGSPPHVRGKESFAALNQGVPGITPACAGKRPTPYISRCNQRDHPRMCGEKSASSGARGMWQGITPACAGKRKVVPAPLCYGRDHPRMCGEKADIIRKKVNTMGSPPHVRGKDSARLVLWTCTGITPACAGKRLRKH